MRKTPLSASNHAVSRLLRALYIAPISVSEIGIIVGEEVACQSVAGITSPTSNAPMQP